MNSQTLPRWLTQKEQFNTAEEELKSNKRHNFLEKTLVGISSAIKEAIFSERYAGLSGFLQRIDARFKVVSFILLLLAASLAHNISVIVSIYCLTLVLAYFSRIPLGFFIGRVWLFIPLYTGIVVFPAIFSFITPGKPILALGSVAITEQGVTSAITLITRVGASVSIAVLLVLTTRWEKLMRALHVLYIPQTFILVLEMTYRYIFFFLKILSDMHLARKSRTIQTLSGSENRRWITSRMGVLFKKSQLFSEQVYLAMLSRGYTGDPKAVKPGRARHVDYAWLFASAGILALVILLNYRLG